jgi:hypothetical protein
MLLSTMYCSKPSSYAEEDLRREVTLVCLGGFCALCVSAFGKMRRSGWRPSYLQPRAPDTKPAS